MSETVKLDEQFMRQADFIPRTLWDGVNIHIVGCGGIGSVTGLALAKIGGTNFTLYDDDVISRHNIPNQMLSAVESRIGQKKVADLGGIMLDFGGEHINVKAYSRKVTVENGLNWESHEKCNRHIIICGPDSMKARTCVWNHVIERVLKEDDIALYVDGRMSSRIFRLYSVIFNDNIDFLKKKYEETLYTDEQAEPLPCSDRSVFHTNMVLAAMIAEQCRRAASFEAGIEAPPNVFEILFDLVNLTFFKREICDLQ